MIAEKIFRDAEQLSLSMSGMMLFRNISCKIPIFQTLGGWGGIPRSVNDLNIYTFDLDYMFGLHVRHCSIVPVGFALFSSIFIRSYTLSYVCYNIVLGLHCPFCE